MLWSRFSKEDTYVSSVRYIAYGPTPPLSRASTGSSAAHFSAAIFIAFSCSIPSFSLAFHIS